MQARDNQSTIDVGGQKVSVGIPGSSQHYKAAVARWQSQIPLKRASGATTAEAAGAMLALASPLTAFVTGQVLEVNGGQFM